MILIEHKINKICKKSNVFHHSKEELFAVSVKADVEGGEVRMRVTVDEDFSVFSHFSPSPIRDRRVGSEPSRI
jgi:hypothetical protein